ncbi:MAG: NADH-quinone oxidoreductase subunit L [Hyphomicrobiales bacterium]|nr:NADH-quinone oxidoreductase subunit L [Hyphomicrobiales bacterium]
MLQLVLALPLAACIIAGLFGKYIGHRSAEIITCACVSVSAVLSIILFYKTGFQGETMQVGVLDWLGVAGFASGWSLRLDGLTGVMLVVVTLVSALVHIYSVGYMGHDPHRARFFAYLSLFTFMMLALVTANDFLQLFFGWEGVGLASYLLIGFWFKKPAANNAAIKAFVVNRVGDLGLVLAIAAIFATFGSIQYDAVFSLASTATEQSFDFFGTDVRTLDAICLLLFLGAMGKSAQFFLHTWLPDAMEGPTPVSALIHAATMVTAGVFLIARTAPLFELSPLSSQAIVLIGAVTAFFAASVALVQNDIKRVVAYSTCSQLGYMFVAMGVGAYEAGMFHLFTHAFFKALLFLGAGSVIHALSDEQDLRKMGGLVKHLPFTYLAMLAGTLALTGVPFTSGYFSKDAIIEATYITGGTLNENVAFVLILAALFTSFYSWRLFFLAFHGNIRTAPAIIEKIHESPNTMLLPLAVLAVGALAAGGLFYESFIGGTRTNFWGVTLFDAASPLDDIHHVSAWIVYAPLMALIAGLAIAALFYLVSPKLPARIAQVNAILYNFLLNKWYIDEIYNFLFVKPAMRLGALFWKQGDGAVIDRLGPDGVSKRVLDITRAAVRLQTGYFYHYAFAMLIGVCVFTTWFLLTKGN